MTGRQARHAPVSDSHDKTPNPVTPTHGMVAGTGMSVRGMAGHQVGGSSCGQGNHANRAENVPGVILVRSTGTPGNNEPFSAASPIAGRRDAVWSSENNATPSTTRKYHETQKQKNDNMFNTNTIQASGQQPLALSTNPSNVIQMPPAGGEEATAETFPSTGIPPTELATTVGATESGETASSINPPLKRVSELECIPADDPSYLLGNRLLRRGEFGGFVGPSGLGKSTTGTQLAMHWSAGLPALGLAPLSPMRVVMVQGENDEAEMCMLTSGIIEAGEFTPEQIEKVEANFVMAEVTTGDITNGRLMPLLKQYVKEHDADLVILDPLFVYYSGEINSASSLGKFLRDLAQEFKEMDVAVLFVHHTAKRKTAQGGSSGSLDPVYGSMGSSEFSNVARIIFTLDHHPKVPGYAKLMIGKRGGRSPWTDVDGKRVSEIHLKPSGNPETPFWKRCEIEDMPVAPAVDKMTKGRNAILSALGQGEFEQKALQGKVQAEQVSRKTFKDALKELVRAGAIERIESSRPGTRAAIHWRLPAGDGAVRADTSGVTTGNIPPSEV